MFIAITSIVMNVGFILFYKYHAKTRAFFNTSTDVIKSSKPLHEHYSYYLYCDTLKEVTLRPEIKDAPTLPDNLIVSPGIYKAGGSTVDMSREGMYRLIFPDENNYQVIVYKHNLLALLSSISWIHTHGNIDNDATAKELKDKALHDKIYLTCSRIAGFACKVLTQQGYKTRMVGGIAGDSSNGFDDEHTMMEVLDPATNKWILADIDNNSIFRYRDSTGFLNFAQFRDALYNDKLEFYPLSKDVRYDISGFKSKNDYAFGFIMERLHNKEELTKWYRRIFRNVLVEGDVYTASDKDVIHRKHPEYTFRDSLSFKHKYYEPTLSSYASQHSVTEHGLKKQTHNSYKSKRKE
jgi:hypothetical protein